MIRLTKYLKPYLSMIVLSIMLLFVQANADLALPDYLSRIVNIGIQQGGVDSAVPTAIRANQMERLSLFLTPEETVRVLAAYTRVDVDAPDYAATVQAVPGVADEPVYILASTDDGEIAWLDSVMAKALLSVRGLEQVMANPTGSASAAEAVGMDLTSLPPGADLFALLKSLPAAQRDQIGAAMQAQFAALGERAVRQAAIGAVKTEYDALGMNTSGLQTRYILRTGLLMLLITLVSVAATVAVGYLSARTAAGLSRDLRHLVFQKVESFSSAEIDRFSTASLITRTTNDVTQVQMVVIMMMRLVFYAPVMGVGGIIRAVDKGSSMWWVIAVGVAMLLSLVAVIFSLSLPKFKAMQQLIDRLNLVLRENLSGMMVIRAFAMQPHEQQRFDKANLDLTDTSLFVNRVMVVMFPTMMLIMSGMSLLIIWIGSHQVAQAQMQVGDMMAFMQYAMQIVFSFLMMSMMFIFLPRAAVSGGRIADVLETEPTIRDSDAPRSFPEPFNGTVEFRNVSFRYPDADTDVLSDISFTALPGETTAFIGSTGSGKSTVINLIPRFYDVTAGQILIDGVDIRDVPQHDLRARIGYIPQKSSLFTGTVESNLRYADEGASEEALREAIEIAQVTEFVESSLGGMATEIAQGGANVSGGQKQRLSIARALVKHAPIYILDDSFSALDFKTDAALRRAMKERVSRSAVLVVTQRVSTVMNAQKIVVLEMGRVVGIGTHPDLLETCPTYREIALSQLSLEELS
ncbi:MAG: ABC transporter ATP-binding protein/permease [Anaerolineae bacterium]|nr:ABC transporter ATP-binding protein/permease [Anaerolineae bacterium]